MGLNFLKFKPLHEDAILPTRSHDSDAGLDLYLTEDVVVTSGKVTVAPTGYAVEIPVGYVGLIHPRSGLAFKQGITVVNAPGTIDSDYRGEIKVALTTLEWDTYSMGHRPPMPVGYNLIKGDRIAQLVIQAVELPLPVEVDELTGSVRSEAGFGSTGR